MSHCDESAYFTQRTPRIVNAAKLNRAATRRKTGRFLAEGPNCVEGAIRTKNVIEIYATDAAEQHHEQLLADARAAGLPVHPINQRAADHLADTVTTTGLFALCHTDRALVAADEIIAAAASAGSRGLVAVAVDIADPGNAGTIIRMADALGAAGVIFAGQCVDPLGGKVLRSTAGSLFNIPVARHRDTTEVIAALQDHNVVTLATTMTAELTLGADELPAAPTAWLFGNEAHGLDQKVLGQADHTVAIPIVGAAESLNLATAAAMCLWESARGHTHPL
ncbi:RNA methyltransferase [Corynebacterium sp. TAE3-ERU12]|uniref:TrmH family RNA methyltransferase n=1 Tax=Corynebacterium sp. TAE3-ERU12 TaxID=2849491 RepID=UPI001C47BD78|nr:RNA methyltransferase [Corynebacterium sp. TAE3-ERU12]MBV7296125.1 RNA methyltransferase [Corynebacterium sp. TAE3-ERU12]